MWPDRRICELFKIDHPIVQAPMALSDTPELAGAVSNAGGLGSLGCGEMSLNELRTVVATLRSATSKPFNLNFFIHGATKTEDAVFQQTRKRLLPWYEALGLGEPPSQLPAHLSTFDDDHLSLLLEVRPAVVSFHFGTPDLAVISALKKVGIVLISSATTVAEAQALEASGMDAVIAQGWEAGGHRGSHQPSDPSEGVGTFALVPQIVDAVKIPVIAAGGVGDGRGIAAAFALGASGVQIGTAFLSCPEAGTDPRRRTHLLAAKESDTMVTNAISGRSARVKRSRYAEVMDKSREPLPAYPQLYALSDPLLKVANDEEISFHLYGQAARLNRDLPAAVLLHSFITDAVEAFGKLAKGMK
jgi:nitronate monooxygenase